MTHVFDKYLRKHGHYPRIQADNGVQKLTVEFAPGYVRIKTSPPFGGEVYIAASTIRHLLKSHTFTRMLGLHRKQDRSFDVPRAVHASYLAEQEHLEALKIQKRDRSTGQSMTDVERRERQHRRWLKARARQQET